MCNNRREQCIRPFPDKPFVDFGPLGVLVQFPQVEEVQPLGPDRRDKDDGRFNRPTEVTVTTVGVLTKSEIVEQKW